MTMSVTEAVRRRRSVRAYRDAPVDEAQVAAILRLAAQAPSGGNIQPWSVRLVGGADLVRLKGIMRRRCAEAPDGDSPTQGLLPADLPPDQTERHARHIRAVTQALGGPKDDPVTEQVFLFDHFQFFGAPLGAFVLTDRKLEAPQWLDLGLYVQTAMLLLCEAGLDTCYIGAWSRFEATVRGVLELPGTLGLVGGIAIGHADPEAAINQLPLERDDPLRA